MFDQILLAVFSGILSSFLLLYIYCKLNNDGKFKIDKRFLLCFLFSVIVATMFYMITMSSIRIVFVYCLIVLAVLYFYKHHLKTIVASLFLGYVLVTLSEVIVGVLFTFIMQLFKLDIGDVVLNVYANIGILVIGVLIINIKRVTVLCQNIVKLFEKVRVSQALLIGVVGVLLIGSFMYCSHLRMPLPYMLLLSVVVLSMYLVVAYQYTKEMNDRVILQKEYEILNKTLSDYETMYEHQRIVNHENKNQFLIVRSLASKENKELISYIDELTNVKIKDSEELMNLLKRVPYGGVRGLLYSKFIQMQQDRIKYSFIVSRAVKMGDFKKINQNNNNLLCKMLGILLDNAIDATKNTKDKKISVIISKEKDDLIISVSNTFNQKIEIDKMYNKGYTTKGDNHGYGLAIVKEIVDNSNKFVNQIKINGEMFTQIIKIKN